MGKGVNFQRELTLQELLEQEVTDFLVEGITRDKKENILAIVMVMNLSTLRQPKARSVCISLK